MSEPSAASATSSPALRPALARLAAEHDSVTSRKLWKALTVPERQQALLATLAADEQGWVKARVQGALVKAKRYRPQTVAAMNAQKLASELAPAPVDDAALMDAALVDLHFGHRRALMGAFLDALGVPHEEGRLPEDTSALGITPEKLRAAADRIASSHPPDELYVYFLTLVLQDRATWGALGDWMQERTK